ncbi:MAG: hypothetical protein NW206_04530 [Hyphomonadaceae bacterium]|nr:hypothetical protein [Hyphomonadaceae bacterium]
MHIPSRLIGPFRLTEEGVNAEVAEDSPGAYALGFDTPGVFTVVRVDRADGLRTALLERAREGKYPSFKYLAVADAREAFDLECLLFHEFGGSRHLDNTDHPQRPDGSRWLCPDCTHYGIRDWAALAR